MQFSGNFKGKPPVLSIFWAQGPSLGSKLYWAPWPKSWICVRRGLIDDRTWETGMLFLPVWVLESADERGGTLSAKACIYYISWTGRDFLSMMNEDRTWDISIQQQIQASIQNLFCRTDVTLNTVFCVLGGKGLLFNRNEKLFGPQVWTGRCSGLCNPLDFKYISFPVVYSSGIEFAIWRSLWCYGPSIPMVILLDILNKSLKWFWAHLLWAMQRGKYISWRFQTSDSKLLSSCSPLIQSCSVVHTKEHSANTLQFFMSNANWRPLI